MANLESFHSSARASHDFLDGLVPAEVKTIVSSR